MLATIVLLMNWKCAHSNQKWQVHVSQNCAPNELEIRTILESKWQEHVNNVCAAHEIEIRTV